MAGATIHELTLHLPQNVIEMLRQAADERQESPDEIVAEAIQFVLDPLRQEALRRLNKQVLRQRSQSESQIREHLDSHLANEVRERLSQLLEQSRTEGLNAEEHAELERLFEQIEANAIEKAAAIHLLSGKVVGPHALPWAHTTSPVPRQRRLKTVSMADAPTAIALKR